MSLRRRGTTWYLRKAFQKGKGKWGEKDSYCEKLIGRKVVREAHSFVSVADRTPVVKERKCLKKGKEN